MLSSAGTVCAIIALASIIAAEFTTAHTLRFIAFVHYITTFRELHYPQYTSGNPQEQT